MYTQSAKRLARARSSAPLVYKAWVAAYLTDTGDVRAIFLMLGADWHSIRACPLAAVAFRCLGAVVDGGPFTHSHLVICKMFRVGRKCGGS